MFSFFKRPPPLLLGQVDTFRRLHPDVDMVVAIQAFHAPHGGKEVFWFYRDGDWFDGHAARTARDGSLRVRRCRVPLSKVWGPVQESGFHDLKDARSEMIDGLTYHMAVASAAGSHCVFGAQNPGQPQTRLFDALTGLFEGG